MSDADCTPGREPRSIAGSLLIYSLTYLLVLLKRSGRRYEDMCDAIMYGIEES